MMRNEWLPILPAEGKSNRWALGNEIAAVVVLSVVVVVVFSRHDSLVGVTSDRSWLILLGAGPLDAWVYSTGVKYVLRRYTYDLTGLDREGCLWVWVSQSTVRKLSSLNLSGQGWQFRDSFVRVKLFACLLYLVRVIRPVT